MNREQLLKKRSDLKREMEDLHAQLTREFSEEKQTAFDEKKRAIAAIDAELARMDALEALEPPADNKPADETQRGIDPPATPPTPPAPGTDAAKLETARCLEITDLCRQFHMEEQARGYIEKGDSLETVRAAVLEKLAKDNPPLNSASRAVVGEEGVDKLREAGSDALILRSGLNIGLARRGETYKPAEGAEELRHLGIVGLMREYVMLRMPSKNVNRMTVDELRRAVFTPDSQFSAMLDNTINKSMAIGYQDAGVTFDQWTKPGSLSDFKATRRYRLSEADVPAKILQNGEFKHDAMTDERVEMQLETWGIMFSLTREGIINDDLDYLTKKPAAYVRGFRRVINQDVYGILNNNSNYSLDGTALFTSGHGNLAGTAAHPSTASIALARAAMRNQMNMRSKEYIRVAPKFFLTGTELETDVETILASVADPSGNNSGVVNPFRGKFVLISDPDITSETSSEPDWFLAADPYMVDTIEVAYLNGNTSPIVESTTSFEQLGMKWRIYSDWDIDIVDVKGLYKVPGLAAV